MLLVLGIWRHVVRRVVFRYDPLYWGLVFPLGMYCVCTYRLVETFELPFLAWLSRGFVVVAIIAWMLTFFGLVARFLYLILLAARALERPTPVNQGAVSRLPAFERTGANQSSSGGQS